MASMFPPGTILVDVMSIPKKSVDLIKINELLWICIVIR